MIALIPLWSTALLAIGGQAIRFEQSCLLALASALLIVLGALWSFHKKDDTEWILIKLRALAH